MSANRARRGRASRGPVGSTHPIESKPYGPVDRIEFRRFRNRGALTEIGRRNQSTGRRAIRLDRRTDRHRIAWSAISRGSAIVEAAGGAVGGGSATFGNRLDAHRPERLRQEKE